ncbi:MAG: hemerythrin family protein [Clostridiales bacterium]|nr:hemerythrin family protein [Clostridiales bacterium]
MDDISQGIAWKDKYRLGNKQVDEQHYQLFLLVSKIVEYCTDGSDITKLKETLDFLVEYTVQHFCDEEALQLRYNYPDYEKHRQMHEAFKITAQNLAKKFEASGSSKELSHDVNTIVVNWLVNHILREDKKIGEHIRLVSAQEIV